MNPLRSVEWTDDTSERDATDVRHALEVALEPAVSRVGPEPPVLPDLVEHLTRQRDFSERTFGPGNRTAGVVDHIRKELREIESQPNGLSEWIDVVILGFDGAWRAGHEPEQIAAALVAKQRKNEARQWPDWRTADPNKAIEHNRPALTGEPASLIGRLEKCAAYLAACAVEPPPSYDTSLHRMFRDNPAMSYIAPAIREAVAVLRATTASRSE